MAVGENDEGGDSFIETVADVVVISVNALGEIGFAFAKLKRWERWELWE